MVVPRWTALLLLALLLAGCARGGASTDDPPPPPAPGAPPPAAGPGEGSRVLPVYYVAETAAGPRLQREFHSVVSPDAPSAAVREMLAEPTGTDPDYRNPWPPGTALRAPVTNSGDVTTVDLTGLGAGRPAIGTAELAVQQLVFTVQGALQDTDPVRILIDGSQVDELWGVDTSAPVARGDAYALRSLVQIDVPAHGAEVGRTVEVSGEAAVFEATLLWEVRRGDTVVRSGSTNTAEGQRFAPYAFEIALEPGEYVLRVLEDDASGGEGRPVLVDDKTIEVS